MKSRSVNRREWALSIAAVAEKTKEQVSLHGGVVVWFRNFAPATGIVKKDEFSKLYVASTAHRADIKGLTDESKTRTIHT